MAKFYNNQIEEECEQVEVPRFKEQELDHRDYFNVEAAASAARGAIKGFIGGSLMTVAYRMFITSTAKSVIRPFCGGMIGAAGLAMAISSFDEWKEAVIGTVRYIRYRIEEDLKERLKN